MTRKLFHGTRGALRLGVGGFKPLDSWDDFPSWRRLYNAWMTRVNGPFTSEKVKPDSPYVYGTKVFDVDGIRWTKDARRQFNISLPDDTLKRLAIALGLNASYSHVEVVLTGDAIDDFRFSVLEPPNVVDAYIHLVENYSDVAQFRYLSLVHDDGATHHHFQAAKWAIRKGDGDPRCQFDALKKARDAMHREGIGAIARMNWTESELEALGKYELRSLKPVIYVVNVSREEYIRQNPVFLDAVAEQVHNKSRERKSLIVLANVELEEEFAQPNSSRGSGASSVFDDLLGSAIRYLGLTRFYVLHASKVQAWYIPPNTRADVAAGVVFHQSCDAPDALYLYDYHRTSFCTTLYYYFNEAAKRNLAFADVLQADVLASHATSTLGKKDFTRKDRDYRIQEGDVVKFTVLHEGSALISFSRTGPSILRHEQKGM